jgi:cell division protein FtsI (penicillin-binding protein 3)
MAGTAQVGTGHRAALQDVSVGVKTGTAQMLDTKRGGYSTEDFLSNCMAVFPVENPQVILYIAITKARGETYAGRIVAPVIQKAADIITDHIGLNRENSVRVTHSGVISIPQITAARVGSVLPDFEGLSKKELAYLIEIPNLNVVINGEGWVYAQNPPPGTPITEGMKIELYLE